MKSSSKISATIFGICFLVISSFVITNGQNKIENNNLSFRYVIAFNEVMPSCEKCTRVDRRLITLMKKEDFTEENLKKLYSLMIKRFPNPTNLIIIVEKDINAIPTPEERETRTFILPKSESRDWATMFHDIDNKVFRIDICSNSNFSSIEMSEQ